MHSLPVDLELAGTGLARAAGELAVAGLGLGRAAVEAVWTGHGAEIAFGLLATDLIALAECAAGADRAARRLQIAAGEALALAAAVDAWP
jgi:hypothetical protein